MATGKAKTTLKAALLGDVEVERMCYLCRRVVTWKTQTVELREV